MLLRAVTRHLNMFPLAFAASSLLAVAAAPGQEETQDYRVATADVISEYEASKARTIEQARDQAARLLASRQRMQDTAAPLAGEAELVARLTPEPPTLSTWMASKRLQLRWKNKRHLPGIMFQGRVFDEGFSELVWFDEEGRKFSALVAADLSDFGQMPVFESGSAVIKPMLLIHSAGSITKAKDAANLQAAVAALAANPPPPIRYVTGHQPESAPGEADDFACIDAILDAVEMEKTKAAGTTTRLPGGDRLIGEVAP